MALITAANLAAAKNGVNLPGSFNATHPQASSAPAKSSASTPTTTPATSSGAGVSSGGTSYDPAAAAAAAALAKAETNYHNEQASTMNTINTGISSGAGDYNQSILDAFNGSGGFKSQQNNINEEQIQNELSRLQGMQGVRNMVNNGIQGAGVVLDNAGAGTSSAGDAVARAYGIQGRQQASSVGEQAAQGENSIQNDQNNLNSSENNFVNVDEPTKKADIINSIVSSANQSLTYLNAIASSANLPDQINIAQQIAQIKANATAALSAFDSELSSNMASNAPQTSEQYGAKASQLFAAGTAPAQEFNYTSEAPATLQNTGPAESSLPIYISSASNKNDNGIVQ